MASSMAALVLCALLAAAAASSAAAQRAGAAAQACYFLDKDGGVCVPSAQNALAVAASLAPRGAFRKASLMALDRAAACSGTHTTESACAQDAANRCFWRVPPGGGQGICLSADYAEVAAFERSGFAVGAATIPSAMTCPGTKAAQFFACYAHPAPETCAKLPGCAPAPAGLVTGNRPVCLPAWAAKLDVKASQALAAQIGRLDAAVFGNCEAACWLRQARACSLLGSDEAACSRDAACAFNPIAKACLRAAAAPPGKDKYDDALAGLMGGCAKLSKKGDCVAKRVKLEQAGKWRTWAPATAASC
ncbi:hypothetical protein HT031_000585 [Scenedesmus sp. PABB004]|nr:hypothetical protein HT031_000585 [Scenedesmus sp. PABB004]